MRKKSYQLPHVKDILHPITINEAGEYMYQNITLAGFDDAKNQVAQQKSTLSNEICECIKNRLKEENESKSIFKLVPQILNTEGCIRINESGWTNLESADYAVTVLLEHFATRLQNARLTPQAAESLLLEYAHEYLSVQPHLILLVGIISLLHQDVPHGKIFYS